MERPLRRAFLPVLSAAVAAAILGAACTSSTGTPEPTAPAASAEPASPAAASPDTGTSASPAPVDSQEPLPTESAASESPASPEPAASPEPTPGPTEPATACSGSLDNRTFFEGVASQVQWAVYCAVLPQGWFVRDGQANYATGGHMEITYKGPNGALLTLEEGNVCTSGASACAPKDHEIGTVPYGDRQGTLVTLGDGGFAVYVEPGHYPSWSATGSGLDQGTFTSLVQALYHVSP